MDVEHGEMLARETGIRAVFINSRRPHGKWWLQISDGLTHFFDGLLVS